jgi:putative peptidoglycan lipid II flippase
VLSVREEREFDRTSAGSTRAVLLMSWLGTAVIAAIAIPAANVLAKQPDQVSQLIEAFLLFAPGIAGTTVIANLSRVMLVIGRRRGAGRRLADHDRGRRGAGRAGSGPPGGGRAGPGYHHRPDRGGHPAGIRHPPDLQPGRGAGAGHAALAGLAACAAGAAVGVAVSLAVPLHHKLEAVALAVLAAGGAILVFGVVAYFLDDGDLKTALAWVRRVTGSRS